MNEPGRPEAQRIRLVEVDDRTLESLVVVAVRDANADDVTPPIGESEGWSPARIDWLRDIHRDRRAGLNGPAGEVTMAIHVGNSVAGAARLKQTSTAGILETGIWLAKSARGQGVGSAAMLAVLDVARTLGAIGIRADTTAGNMAALGTLERLGFELEPSGDGINVAASCRLFSRSPSSPRRPRS